MNKVDLESLLQKEEVVSNSNLLKDLEDLLEDNKYNHNIYSYPNSLSVITYGYLLDNKHISSRDVLGKALYTEDQEKRDELIDLALFHGVDLSSMYYSLSPSISTANLEKFIAHGLSLNKAIKLILSSYASNKKEIASQIKLMEFLVGKGVSLVDVSYISNSFSKKTYEYMLKHGLKANVLLEKSISTENQEKRDELMDLALSHEVDFSSMSSLSSSISIANLEKFIAHGLSLNKAIKLILSSYPSNEKTIASKIKLMKFLVGKGGSLVDVSSIDGSLSKETYEYMLEHGLKASVLLKKSISTENQEKCDELIDLALAYKVDLSSMYDLLSPSISIANLEKFIAHGLSLNTAIKLILSSGYSSDKKAIASQIKLMEFLVGKGGSLVDVSHISSYFSKETYEYMLEHGLEIDALIRSIIHMKFGEKYDQLMEFILTYKEDAPNLVLKYAVYSNNIEMLKLALAHGADVNAKFSDEDYCLLAIALLSSKNVEIIDLLIESGISLELTSIEYAIAIKSSGINNLLTILPKLSNIPSDAELYELSRSHGESESSSTDFVNYSALINEYILAKYGMPTSLSKADFDIIDGKTSVADIDYYRYADFTNKYGYTPLHLALLTKNYYLAKQMVESGFDLYAQSNSGTTPLHLLRETRGKVYELMEAISEKIDDVDMDLGSGETLVNYLLRSNELSNKTIALSNDSLIYLLKQDADLFFPSRDLSKTNIAISDGDGFWSTGIWSVARMISSNYSDVNFYLVRENILKEGGEPFFKQFDAVINPGAGDNFPKLEEFTKKDCLSPMPLETHYQTMLEYSNNHNIPYLGMCAGAQHLSLYHDGSLKRVEGYGKGSHQVNFIKGTLSYFMSLTKEQQSNALENCELPEVIFKGDTAHHYAAVNDKLGSDLQLGAVSEDNVVMSFASNNGIRYSTQFHPEHHYKNKDINAIHQKAWLDNFIEIARMHHDHRVNGDIHPTEYYAEVKYRLEECVVEPTCVWTENYIGLTYL